MQSTNFREIWRGNDSEVLTLWSGKNIDAQKLLYSQLLLESNSFTKTIKILYFLEIPEGALVIRGEFKGL